jgi:hypothetical protein
MAAPTESKVYGATIGGGAGATLTAFVLWLLGVLIWHVSSTAPAAGDAIAAVPLPVAGVLTGLITLGGVYGGGWLAKHTPRPVDEYQPKRALVEDAPVWHDDPEKAADPVPEKPAVEATDADLLVPEYSTVRSV